jgi:hypothetical protein
MSKKAVEKPRKVTSLVRSASSLRHTCRGGCLNDGGVAVSGRER